jgi:hypothetical protein
VVVTRARPPAPPTSPRAACITWTIARVQLLALREKSGKSGAGRRRMKTMMRGKGGGRRPRSGLACRVNRISSPHSHTVYGPV